MAGVSTMTTLSDMPTLESVPDCECVSECPYKADAVTPSHCGAGILPGDFIKPDPAMTQRETRVYILAELQRWLTGRICEDAKDVCIEFPETDELAPYLEAGTWPAARLYAVLQLLEMNNSYILPPLDSMDRFQFAGQWAAGVCSDYLSGYEPGIPAAVLATGFVTDDILPSGRTIESFWNHSPFAALREAPPLADEAEEAEEDESVKPSIDYPLDVATSFFYRILTSDITLPAWVVVAAAGGVGAVIAAAISRCNR